MSLEPRGVEQAKQKGGSKVSETVEILEPLPKLRRFWKPSFKNTNLDRKATLYLEGEITSKQITHLK